MAGDMTIRGVIFDLDGTLLDTLPDIAAGVNAGRRALGLVDCAVSDIQKWIGEGLPTLCRRALGDVPNVSVEQMLPIVSEYYTVHRLDQAMPFAGIPELLDALVARGVPIAILSNKPHEHTLPMAEAIFGRWPWVAIEGYRQEDRRKPDPRTASEIAQAMCLSPAEIALLGDSDTDMRTAVNAGMVPIGVAWGYRDRDMILSAGAKHMLEKPIQLLELMSEEQ